MHPWWPVSVNCSPRAGLDRDPQQIFSRGRGILVVGHGTADPVGADETRRVAEQVGALLPGVPVALGFLEVIGPSIAESLADLAAAGCGEVVAAPLLLFAAGHAKRDVPEAMQAAATACGLAVRQAEPFGCHWAIASLARRRRQEAVATGTFGPEATTLVMVGRGSSDPTAAAQLAAFTRATLAGEPPPRRVLSGFVAAARPPLPEALAAAADPLDKGVRRILVQPHLLFRGHVEEQVAAAVEAARRTWPGLEWVQVGRLGPDPLVALAVVDRARAAFAESDAAEKTPRQTGCESSQ